MILFLRSLPVILGFVVLAGLSFATRSAELFWYASGATFLCTLAGMWLILRRTLRAREAVVTLTFPALTLLTAIGVLLFSELNTFRYLLALALAAVFWIFCEQAFYFAYQPSRYQPNALVNLNSLLCIVSTFFASVAVFDMQLFASLPLWGAIVAFSAFMLVCTFALLYVLSVPALSRWTWGTVVFLAIVACFGVLAWLPALPVVKAAVLTLPFAYAVVKIREDIAGTPLPSRWTFIVASLVLLLLLATTRWFV